MPVYYEPVKNNIYLEDFYKDMKKHSFAMQVYVSFTARRALRSHATAVS